MQQDIIELDGWSQKTPVVTAIGGFLGQLMIVLNTVAHFYPQLDRPLKSGKSNRKEPKSPKESQKSDRPKSQRSEDPSEAPRNVLNTQVVQNFIYTYINEKLKKES